MKEKNMTEAQELGLQIRAARKARKLTQQDVAAAVGVSLGTIQNLESGKRRTNPVTVVAVRQFLALAGDEAHTISTWPTDVKVITNMIGLWLLGQTEAEREAFGVDFTRRILGADPDAT